MYPNYNLPLDLTHSPYDLHGPKGNAFEILGTVGAVLRRVGRDLGISELEIEVTVDEYRRKATSQDYQHLLKISNQYVRFNWLNSPIELE